MKPILLQLLVTCTLPAVTWAGMLENPFAGQAPLENPFALRPVQVRRQDIASMDFVNVTLSPQWVAELAAPAEGWLRTIVDIGKRVDKYDTLVTLAPVGKPGAAPGRVTLVSAPFAGVVTARRASLGSYVRQAEPLLVLVSDASMRARAALAERDSLLVREGAKAELEVDVLPSRLFVGEVSAVVPWIDPASRLRELECTFPNADRALVAGMAGKLGIPKEIRRNVLVVPRDSLMVEKSDLFVFAVRQGRARKVKIQPGISDKFLVEVRDGVAEGEFVLVNPQSAKEGMAIPLP
jgi:hypothetical protein